MTNLPLSQSRRSFFRKGALWLVGGSTLLAQDGKPNGDPLLRVGLITDLHYADKDPKGTRHYRETLGKLEEAGTFYEKHRPDFVVELGDLIDAADSVETELGYLKRIHRAFSAVCPARHYVLGNHCVDTLTKAEFLGEVGQEASYYSFDRSGVHFIVLDSCFRSDGEAYQRKNFEWTDANVPAAELEWLRADLEANRLPVIIFAHQRLDVANSHGVRNAAAVREILETSGRVAAVFQGHSHQNDLIDLGGIHYVTLRAMVEGSGAENNGYGLLEWFADGSIKLSGGRQQRDYDWAK